MSKILKYLFLFVLYFTCNSNTISQDLVPTDSLQPPPNRKLKKFERIEIMNGKHDEVFAFMDDINNTGMHMTEENGPMLGNKLTLEWLSENKTGLGTKYRWTGKVMGMKMDFTVVVTQWNNGKSKTWETIGEARMIVISWFRMYLELSPNDNGTTSAKLGILYTKSKNIPGFLLGKRYSIWCVKSMLEDTKEHFEKNEDKKS